MAEENRSLHIEDWAMAASHAERRHQELATARSVMRAICKTATSGEAMTELEVRYRESAKDLEELSAGHASQGGYGQHEFIRVGTLEKWAKEQAKPTVFVETVQAFAILRGYNLAVAINAFNSVLRGGKSHEVDDLYSLGYASLPEDTLEGVQYLKHRASGRSFIIKESLVRHLRAVEAGKMNTGRVGDKVGPATASFLADLCNHVCELDTPLAVRDKPKNEGNLARGWEALEEAARLHSS